jgi:hypothetical protein
VAIEWAGKLVRKPAGAVDVLLEDLGGDRRRITIVRPDRRAPSPESRTPNPEPLF